MVDRRGEDLPRLVEVAAGIEHLLDPGAVLGPLLDLVVVAVVRSPFLGIGLRRQEVDFMLRRQRYDFVRVRKAVEFIKEGFQLAPR
jgi:hypothetical protein